MADALPAGRRVWWAGAGRQAGYGDQLRLWTQPEPLHIHLTCLREDVRRQLQAERPYIEEQWRPLPDKLLRHTYYARRVMQPTAMGIYPIKDLADYFHLSPQQLAEYGVALVPTTFGGQRGFIFAGLEARLGRGQPRLGRIAVG